MGKLSCWPAANRQRNFAFSAAAAIHEQLQSLTNHRQAHSEAKQRPYQVKMLQGSRKGGNSLFLWATVCRIIGHPLQSLMSILFRGNDFQPGRTAPPQKTRDLTANAARLRDINSGAVSIFFVAYQGRQRGDQLRT